MSAMRKMYRHRRQRRAHERRLEQQGGGRVQTSYGDAPAWSTTPVASVPLVMAPRARPRCERRPRQARRTTRRAATARGSPSGSAPRASLPAERLVGLRLGPGTVLVAAGLIVLTEDAVAAVAA